MSKELEALNKITYGYGYDENIEILNKSLKALEIIKDKEVLYVYKDCKGTCYLVVNMMGVEIPQEEYELLKEVLL